MSSSPFSSAGIVRCRFARNDILIAFCCASANRLAARDYLASRDTILCRASSCRLFFFISLFWNKSCSTFAVHLRVPSITCVECTMLPPDLVPQFLANDFVISVLRALGCAQAMHARNTFNQLN